ncbi:hypothetical protein [Tautonia rosea]|uniref:hypothetical protein n=1 Tax=Tautonia rosea TaxID=2728037 RepID=UPI0014728CBE|nr:hypothetical protein [Tautonia rosea]
MAEVTDGRRALSEVEPGSGWFVWGTWLLMTVTAVGFVLRFGAIVPFYDDFALVPALVGEQPLTPSFFWSQHFEHRVPLPRLILIGASSLSGNDFRAGMVATVGCLSVLSAGLMIALRMARGQLSYADAWFPVLLLNWGHYSNLLWSWQIAFGLSTLLAVGVGAMIASRSGAIGSGTLIGLGTALMILPLCAASGLVMVPPIAAWLIGLGVVRLRSGRAGGWTAIAAAVPGVVVTVAYFVGYERPPQIDRAPGIGAMVRTGLQFLAIGFGPTAGASWRIGGVVVLVLSGATTLLLVLTAWRNPEERSRALGMLAVLAGFGILAASLAWGRSGTNDRGGLEPRYVTLAAQIPCLVGLAWARFGPRVLRRLVLMLLFTGSLVLLWPNTKIGLDEGRQRRLGSKAVVADLRAGLPPFAIAARHTGFLHSSHDDLGMGLPLLVEANRGVFRGARPNPTFQEVPVGPPQRVSLARWDTRTGTIEATGVDPWATFELPERTFVAGIRIRYDLENGPATSARFKLQWKHASQEQFSEDQQYQQWTLPVGPDREMVIWIAEPIDSFRLQHDNQPSRFQIDEMVLLVPEGAEGS